MKNYIAGTIAATGLIIFVFGMDCIAQNTTRITAEIPFDFYVGSELLPKGRYEFERANRNSLPSSLIIRPAIKSPRKAMIVPTIVASAGRGTEFQLTFTRYSTVHYLSTVHTNVGDVGMKLLRTSKEKQLAKRYEPSTPVTIRTTDVAGN